MHDYKRLKITPLKRIPNSMKEHCFLQNRLKEVELTLEDEEYEMPRRKNEITLEDAQIIAEYVTRIDMQHGNGVDALYAILLLRDEGYTTKQAISHFNQELKKQD